ncbi:hypothetical protein BM1_03665 [Bipolaris maydis]|nr:hypothetical protein BM1_03665 [Bipolaris maydis]
MAPTLAFESHIEEFVRRAAALSTSSFAASLEASSSSEQVYARHAFVRRDLSVNHTQGVTLGVIGAYVVVIALLWNLPYVRWVLWPFKMLVIAFHEFSHAITAVCTGGRVESISLDPHEGGVTHMRGGKQIVTLPAGYLGSSLIGALLTFCGFNIVASKVASIVLGVCFLLTLWWARKDWLTILTILGSLFIGVMSSLYSVWDICDDLILRKVNSSDASVFAKRYGGSSQCWGVIWSIISLLFMVGGILAGLAAFKQSFEQQQKDSQGFIPTMRIMNIVQALPTQSRYLVKNEIVWNYTPEVSSPAVYLCNTKYSIAGFASVQLALAVRCCNDDAQLLYHQAL